MTPLILPNLLGNYAAEPWTPAELASGAHTIAAWNTLGEAAEQDGVVLLINPSTGCYIGGNGNGGARPHGSKVGAPGSKHQLLMALDWYDPHRAMMAWLLERGLSVAESLGMFFEHPQWTRSWAHGQIVPPESGRRFFVPYADMVANPPTCAPLPGQDAANVPVFAFKAAA